LPKLVFQAKITCTLKGQKPALEQAPEISKTALHSSCLRKSFSQWLSAVRGRPTSNDETENASQQDGRIVLERFD